MKRIKLQEAEYGAISSIIQEYRAVETDLTRVQRDLEKLDLEKNDLLEKLESIREKENSFFSEVEKKHGEGKLDLMTMEYITKK